MQAWVSCTGGRTVACDSHALGCDQCGEQPDPDLKHSTPTSRSPTDGLDGAPLLIDLESVSNKE